MQRLVPAIATALAGALALACATSREKDPGAVAAAYAAAGNYEEAARDPHVLERDMLQEVPQSDGRLARFERREGLCHPLCHLRGSGLRERDGDDAAQHAHRHLFGLRVRLRGPRTLPARRETPRHNARHERGRLARSRTRLERDGVLEIGLGHETGTGVAQARVGGHREDPGNRHSASAAVSPAPRAAPAVDQRPSRARALASP